VNLAHITLILIGAGLILGGGLHISNINRIHKKVERLSGSSVSKEDLLKALSIPQGSNFNSLAMTAWMLLFVAIAYLYFLTPAVFPQVNYFQVPLMASNPFGFLVFGLLVAGLIALVMIGSRRLPKDLWLSEVYSFYNLSGRTKALIALSIPVLWLSIASSAYAGTQYPQVSDHIMTASFLLLIIPLAILLMPIYRETWEGIR